VAADAAAAAGGDGKEQGMMSNRIRIWQRSAVVVAVATLLTASNFGGTSAQEQADRTASEQIDLSSMVAVDEPPSFDDPAAAVEAFKAALAGDDRAGLARLLGLDAEKFQADEATASTIAEIRDAAAKQTIVEDLPDRKLLHLGPKLWPFPFPVVKGEDGKWAFDTFAGLEEVGNRRLGQNELEAIQTMREYVEAQRDYAAADRDADGVLEYAQKLVSSEGQTDGLYWPPEQGDGESPAGDFADEAALDTAREGEGYFGYRFRILTSQGDRIAGGAYDYVINGNMIAGFALLAWPVKYEETGVTTFVVSHHGIVYQHDLGPATEEIVPYIDRFDPGDAWQVVND
jgi:hypothetical protein